MTRRVGDELKFSSESMNRVINESKKAEEKLTMIEKQFLTFRQQSSMRNKNTSNSAEAPQASLNGEGMVSQEDIEIIENKINKLERNVDESLAQMRSKLNDKATKKDIEANLCKYNSN